MDNLSRAHSVIQEIVEEELASSRDLKSPSITSSVRERFLDQKADELPDSEYHESDLDS